MVYTLIVNGQSYDLPKKTMKVMEDMEKVSQVDNTKGLSIRDKFKKLHSFIVSLVGEDAATEILGSDKLEEVDLSEVTLTFRKIIDAYDKPLEDYNSEKSLSKLGDLPLEKITEFVKAADKMQQMK